MPKKENLPDRGIVRVTFELPAEVQGNVIHLVGDFTGWEGTPMEKQPDGSWRTTVDLAPASTYEFRYLIDGIHWENDWHADGYVSNAFGQENSVVTTPELQRASGTQGAKARKAPAKKVAKTPAKKAAKAPAGKAAARTTAKTPVKTPAKKTTAATSPAKKSAKNAATKARSKAGAGNATAVTSPPKKSAGHDNAGTEQSGAAGTGGRGTSAGGSPDHGQTRMAASARPTATDGAPDA